MCDGIGGLEDLRLGAHCGSSVSWTKS
jgi:hypothetical protein